MLTLILSLTIISFTGYLCTGLSLDVVLLGLYTVSRGSGLCSTHSCISVPQPYCVTIAIGYLPVIHRYIISLPSHNPAFYFDVIYGAFTGTYFQLYRKSRISKQELWQESNSCDTNRTELVVIGSNNSILTYMLQWCYYFCLVNAFIYYDMLICLIFLLNFELTSR